MGRKRVTTGTKRKRPLEPPPLVFGGQTTPAARQTRAHARHLEEALAGGTATSGSTSGDGGPKKSRAASSSSRSRNVIEPTTVSCGESPPPVNQARSPVPAAAGETPARNMSEAPLAALSPAPFLSTERDDRETNSAGQARQVQRQQQAAATAERPMMVANNGVQTGRVVMQHSTDDSVEVSDPLSAAAAVTDNQDDDEGSMSSSTSTSYRDEWVRLFERKDYVSAIKHEGIKGGLRSSRFRSVCWRVYLECLPEDQSQWIPEVNQSRQKYADIKREHISNRHRDPEIQAANLALNNPLSQEEHSPWNKYFQDKETKQMITQDVIRTFPEIPFFQTSDVREMLINMLFCYCKEHEHLGYKQGMHELLAPLIFILHCDHQACLHAQEISSELGMVKVVLDPNYMEHDAYTMFTHLMDTMEPWYQHGQDHRDYLKKMHLLKAEPFSRPPDYSPTSPLVKKLNRIQEVILKKQDGELYMHLNRLEIQPQVFGIRWIRLLYGREFTLMDLLVLWDAIFADNYTLVLVDYIYVAMLMLVRELLLSSDYTHCMELLMRFPMIGDVRFIIDKALHLRDPQKYSRPANYQYQLLQQNHAGRVKQVSHLAPPRITNRPSPPGMTINNTFKQKTSAVVTSGFNSLKRITTKTKTDKGGPVRAKTTDNLPHPLAQTVDIVSEVSSKPLKKSKFVEESGIEFYTPDDVDSSTSEGGSLLNNNGQQLKRQSIKSESTEDDADPYQQVALLQGKVNDIQNMCLYCSTKMEAHIIQIQDELVKMKLADEDELLLAIAGLKQVKDILKGSLKFACGLDEDELEMTDDHYAEKQEAERALSIKHRDQSEETFLDNDPVVTPEASSSSAAEFLEEDRKTNKQSQSYVSSNNITHSPDHVEGAALRACEEEDSLLTFEGHFNECNNVERTSATKTASKQNGQPQQTNVKHNGNSASNIDKRSSDII